MMQATLDFWRRAIWMQIGSGQAPRVFVALTSLLALCALRGGRRRSFRCIWV
jgi:hypothetical protein